MAPASLEYVSGTFMARARNSPATRSIGIRCSSVLACEPDQRLISALAPLGGGAGNDDGLCADGGRCHRLTDLHWRAAGACVSVHVVSPCCGAKLGLFDCGDVASGGLPGRAAVSIGRRLQWCLGPRVVHIRRSCVWRVFSCSRFGVATFTTCEAVKVHCGTARRARVCAGLKFSECERED